MMDPMSMKERKNVTQLSLVAGILLITYGSVFAYADEVQFPTFTTDGLIGQSVSTHYPSNSTYTVEIILQYKVADPLEVPTFVTWIDETGETFIINLNDEFRMEHYPVEEPVEDTRVQDELDRIDQILDEKKLELVEAQPNLDNYRLCLEEFKAEYPVKFSAWERIGTLVEFELTYQQLYTDHPTVAETNANKKHQECEVRKNYPFVGVYYANKGLDLNPDHSTTDIGISEDTKAYDLRQAEIKAEAFACSDQGKSQGLCKDYLAGEDYKIPKPRMPAWYGTYQDLKSETTDTQGAIDKAMLEMCWKYYPLYSATNAIELPHWLEHCALD